MTERTNGRGGAIKHHPNPQPSLSADRIGSSSQRLNAGSSPLANESRASVHNLIPNHWIVQLAMLGCSDFERRSRGKLVRPVECPIGLYRRSKLQRMRSLLLGK